MLVMGKDIKEQTTKELKRKVKIGKVLLIVCWSAVIVAVVITLSYGKSPLSPGFIAGTLGLFCATIAMWAGAKKINEELARRKD
jgi:hypothetical protein